MTTTSLVFTAMNCFHIRGLREIGRGLNAKFVKSGLTPRVQVLTRTRKHIHVNYAANLIYTVSR